MHIEPLTHCGENGAVYHRMPHIIQQIEAALPLEPHALIERAALQDDSTPGYLADESLVYFIRYYRRHSHDHIVSSLAEILLRRCEKRIKKHFQALHIELVDDAHNDVIALLFRKILDLESDVGDYFQVRFEQALKRLSISVFRHYKQRQDKTRYDVSLSALVGYDSDDPEKARPPSIPASEILLPPATPEEQFLLQESLQTIPELQRSAFVLRYILGWPISSNDPLVPSISNLLGRTPRTIQTWLKNAEKIFAASREDTYE
jgi:DNA-directed RNA polymerase specialized sigma24 family protein